MMNDDMLTTYIQPLVYAHTLPHNELVCHIVFMSVAQSRKLIDETLLKYPRRVFKHGRLLLEYYYQWRDDTHLPTRVLPHLSTEEYNRALVETVKGDDER